jgi:hypothetical protein
VIASAPGPIHPWPIGVGPRYQPAAANVAVLDGRRVDGMQCANGKRFAVHLELFANRRVAIVPRGVGVARSGCRYPLSTNAPTGVVQVLESRNATLADVFRIWGRALSPVQLLSFRGPVSVFVDGKRFTGKPGTVPLTKHAEIVVEVGGHVAPHVNYLFPKGVG